MTVKTPGLWLILCCSLAGCITTQAPERVTIPVPVPCLEKKDLPVVPLQDKVEAQASLYEKVRVLLLHRAELEKYSVSAEALLRACAE